MNKNLTFLTAPVTALFLPQVHRDAAKSSAGRGLLYILYLALVSAVLFMGVLSSFLVPQADEFAKWFSMNMPAMIWTPEGLALEDQQLPQPVKMQHPRFGMVAVIDMNKDAVAPDDFGSAYVFVTARKIYVKKSLGQVQEYIVTRNVQQAAQLPPKIVITGDVATKAYQNMKNAIFLMLPVFIFVAAFFVHLFSNLIYSIAGLLLNLMRKNKLGYGAIFNLTCFATTAGFTLMWLKMISPLRGMPFPFILYVLINLIYMFAAFKITDQEA